MMEPRHTQSFELNTLEMGDSELKSEAFGESWCLLDKKNESATLDSLTSGDTQNDPLQEERIQVSVDHTGDTNPEDFTPIFEMVKRGDFKALFKLFTSDTTRVPIIDNEGSTPLHCAVTLACQDGEWNDNLNQCIILLINYQQMNLNMPNKKGYTAIGLAVHHLHRKCTERMLKLDSAKHLYLDYYPGDRESTVREIIMETFPDLEAPLPAPLMESLHSSDRDIKLLAALQHDKCDIFKENIESGNPNPWYDEPYYSSLLEIACQMKNRKQFVYLLLESGADPNIKNSVTGMPLIHATARSGNFEVLKLLLKKGGINTMLQDNEKQTIFHWLAQVSERKPGDKYKLEDCFNILLDKKDVTKKDIDFRDVSGNTALYIALRNGFRDRAALLLTGNANISVRGNAYPLLLPTILPTLEEILDDCLQSNKEPLTSENLQLTLKNELLTKIVPRIVESKHLKELLKHPVISTFLLLKWLHFRFTFIKDLIFYVVFLLSLTTYILYAESNNTVSEENAASNTTGQPVFNDSNITSGINDSNFTSQPNDWGPYFLWLILMCLTFFLTLREVVQMNVYRFEYVQSPENFLEILLIISSFISCSGVVGSAELKHHSSAVALLLGWFELLMMLGRLPLLSVQMEMLRTVSVTFLRFMAGYVTLLIAFSLSFYILFKGSSEQDGAAMFANPAVSLLKTIVMFTGELEASDLSFHTLPYTSHVIFLLFVVLVAVILLNLLNGLAVSDTGEIRKDAETLSLAARANLIDRIESFVNTLPIFMKSGLEIKKGIFVINPNSGNRIGSAAVRSLLRIIREKSKTREKDETTALHKEWRMIIDKLNALELRQENLEKTLNSQFGESRKFLGK